MKEFYLAHSVSLIDQVRRWQLMMEVRYNIKFINPFTNNPNEKLEELRKLKTKTATTRYLNQLSLNQCIEIMERDLMLIRKSDGVVAYFDRATIGTSQEIITAWKLYGLPVYIITKRYMNHPWLKAIADESGGKMFRNRTEFKKFVKEEFGCLI